MITDRMAAELVERMEGLRKYPNTNKGKKELVAALAIANTPGIASEVINNYVDYGKECPVPSEIRRLVNEYNERLASSVSKECRRCYGTGHYFNWNPDSPNFMKRDFCPCPAGRKLQRDNPAALNSLQPQEAV